MLTKSAAIFRTAKLLTSKNASLVPVRQSHGAWNYRSMGTSNPPFITYAAEGVCAVAWWWVLWHLWTEPGHITGEFEYPDPSKWTNKELGVPED